MAQTAGDAWFRKKLALVGLPGLENELRVAEFLNAAPAIMDGEKSRGAKVGPKVDQTQVDLKGKLEQAARVEEVLQILRNHVAKVRQETMDSRSAVYVISSEVAKSQQRFRLMQWKR
jgi:hypothetical protein